MVVYRSGSCAANSTGGSRWREKRDGTRRGPRESREDVIPAVPAGRVCPDGGREARGTDRATAAPQRTGWPCPFGITRADHEEAAPLDVSFPVTGSGRRRISGMEQWRLTVPIRRTRPSTAATLEIRTSTCMRRGSWLARPGKPRGSRSAVTRMATPSRGMPGGDRRGRVDDLLAGTRCGEDIGDIVDRAQGRMRPTPHR
jgi:hypothetical protein